MYQIIIYTKNIEVRECYITWISVHLESKTFDILRTVFSLSKMLFIVDF
jgi:hypothetical protein